MMKLLLLTLLCICGAECRPDEAPLGKHLGEKFKESIDRALKRKYGDSFGGTDDDLCAKNCVQVPPQGFGQVMVPFREWKLETVKNFYNKEKLIKVCDYARTTATCVRACPETQRRAFLQDLFAPIKYMCEDSHFVDNADCYREVWESESERCSEQEQCGRKKADFHTKFNIYRASKPMTTKPEVEAMIGSFCTLLDCSIKCGRDKRVEKCTMGGSSELAGFWQKMGEGMKTTRYLSPHDFVIDVPESCGEIGHY